jgi:hypothetical protein
LQAEGLGFDPPIRYVRRRFDTTLLID